MSVIIPGIVLGLIKSVLPGAGLGFLIDLVRNYRKPIARSAAHYAADVVHDLFDDDRPAPPQQTAAPSQTPPQQTAAPSQTRPQQTAAPSRAQVDQPIAALGLDSLTTDVLLRTGITSVARLRDVPDLEDLPGVGSARAQQIRDALKAHNA